MHFNGGLFVWTLLTFAGLVALLARFAFKPLRAALDKRETAIRESLNAAEKARDEAKALLEDNDAKLNEAREEARHIISEGHKIVTDMKREASERAREEADTIVSQARREIDREVQKSLDDLKSTVAGLSVRISRQVIRGELDEERHEQLADDFIERLKKSHAARK